MPMEDDEQEDQAYSESESDKDDKKNKKDVFKAAKLNPVLYEDSQTKKERRMQLLAKKKASHSDYVNELRREIYDLPEEVHLGGMSTQRTRFMREQEQIERFELENFKRMQFTKSEIKDMRRRQ